jgi:hypothetical protein
MNPRNEWAKYFILGKVTGQQAFAAISSSEPFNPLSIGFELMWKLNLPYGKS